MTTTTNQYSLIYQNCSFDAQYNTKHFPKEKNKWRLGVIFYKEIALYGNDPDFNLGWKISTKDFHYGCGHSWTETKDGDVIDWVVNWKLGVPIEEKCVWTKAELTEKGFLYHYYDNEDAIRKKLERRLGKCDKKKNPNEQCVCECAKEQWKSSAINSDFFKYHYSYHPNPKIGKKHWMLEL
jgi:hypothetical protein